MILDNISQIHKYRELTEKMKIAVDFIEGLKNKVPDNGRIDLEEGVYAVISEYNTIDEEAKKWEAHRRFIDLQYILKGSELMGYQNIERLKASHGYDETKDIEFFDYKGSYSQLLVEEGMYAIFYPEDGHAPCIFYKDEAVKKVLIKIPV